MQELTGYLSIFKLDILNQILMERISINKYQLTSVKKR